MADKTIKIKGEFDASGILASFKKIRDEAAKSGVGDKILAGYDKELAKVEKLTTSILASAGKGLTNSNDIKEYTRLVNQLEKAYGILNVKAQGFADANNYTKENAEVRKYMNQLQGLIQKQDSLRKAAESYIDTNKKNLKLNEDEAKALKKSIADAQEYKKVVDEIVQSKMKAAQQKMGAAVVKATGGQQALDEIDNRPGKFDFAAAEKKGRDPSRKALVNKNGTVKEDEAIIAANLEYNRILKETIQNGGSAEDAMAELTKTMKAYKLELTNADEVQKQFAEDIEKVYEAASQSRDNLNQGEKTALTKGINERNAAKNLVGTLTNENIANVQQNADQIADAENQVNQVLEKREQELVEITGLMKSNASAAEQASNTEIEKQKQVIAEAQKYVSVQDNIQKGFDRIGQGAKQILSVTTSWRAFRNVIKSTFNDIKDLDKAFGSIAMVTSYSVKDMWAQYDQYAAMANKLGQSTKSVVEASALYYQQGLKTNEVMQLTEETMKLATLAGLDFKEATSQMTAALRAFHMDMSEGAHVTDVYAEVAAHAAVDVQGLSEAMSACAAIANSSGMAFETTTAMLATMTEATQEAPKNLGTAMKTILARFTELKNNVAGTADSEFDDLDYNKVDKALKSVGISIKDATGQFRNMDDVLLELSGKWKGLDRNSQRYIATIAAGSRQQSRFIALMENYERTMELVNVAQNSAGRSSQQFAKYQDTVEYRLNKISNTWEQFKTNLLTSDFYKDVLDNFNGFLNKLNDTSAAGLATLAGTWLTFGRKAIGGMVSGYSNLLGNLGKPKDSTAFKEDYLHKNQSNYLDENGILTGEAQDQLFKDADEAWEQANAKAKIKSQALGQIISTGLTTAITAGLTIDDPISAGLAASATSAASLLPTFIQLGKTLGAGTGTAIGIAVTAGIGLVSGIISWIKKIKQEAKEATTEFQIEKLKKEIEDLGKDIEDKKNQVKNTQNEIKNLQEIKDTYSTLANKVYKTTEEQEKYNQLVEDIKSNYPELIESYDKETNQLKLQNDLLDEKIQKNKILQQTQQKQTTATELYQIDKQKQLNYLNFQQQLKDQGYLKGRDNILPENGQYLSKTIYDKDTNQSYRAKLYNEREIYNLAESVNFDADKIKELLQEQLDQGLITQQDLKIITTTVKQYASDQKNLFNNYLSSAKDYVTNSGVYSNLTEEQKNAASYLMAGKMNNYSIEDLVDEDEAKIIMGDIVEGIFKNDKATAYEDLSAESISLLDKYLISKEQYEAATANKNNAVENLMSLIAEQKRIEKSELTEQDLNNISEIQKLTSKMDFSNYEKIQKEVEQYNSEGLNKYIKTYTESFEKYKQQLEEIGIKSIDNFQILTEEETKVQSQIIDNLEKTFGKSENTGKLYENLINGIKSLNISSELQQILLNFDPSDLKGENISDAKEILLKLFNDAINSGKIGKETAEKVVEQYLSTLKSSGIQTFSIKSTITLETETKKVEEKLQGIVKNYKTAIDTINSNIANGFIDVLDKDKIEEAINELGLNASDYFYQDNLGNFQVDIDRLNKDIETQVFNEEEIVKQMKAEAELGLQELKQEKAIVDSLLDQMSANAENLNISKEKTKELAKQVALQNNLAGNGETEYNKVLTQFGISEEDGYYTIDSKIREQIETRSKELETEIKKYSDTIEDGSIFRDAVKNLNPYKNAIKDIYKTHTDAVDDFKKKNDDAYKDWVDKSKAVTDAQKSLAKAVETVTEKQKELANVIKGTDWKSSLDGMYNYDTALDALTKKTERAKKELDKSMDETSAKRNAQIYGQGLLDQKANIQAQIQAYQKAIQNYNKTYRDKLGPELNKWEEQSKTKFDPTKYASYNSKTGRYQINMNQLQKDQLPKEIKSWVEQYIKTVNEYQGKVEDLQDKEKELDEEWLEWKKQVRDDYIDLQQKMMDVLREKYQQEIDDLQNKYDTMEEADSKYLEALQKNIDKQRKLRDQENSWRELTDKERKLSLMQRDTSRGNAAEIKSLEKEVENDRTQLLDNAVDDIIEKLQEFYDLQKESRDAEIEYRETLLEDVNLLKEVTEELKKIHTSEDLVNWWKDNVSNISQMSEEEFNREKEEWSNLITAKVNYSTSVDETITQSIETSEQKLRDVADETQQVVETTSEQITTIAETTLKEAGEEYQKAIKAAKDALQDAVDAVQKQKEALQAAIDAANESKKAFDDIHNKYMEYLKSQEKTTVYKVGNAYLNQGQLNSYMVSNKGDPKKYGNETPTAVQVTKDKAKDLVNTTPPKISVEGAGWGKETKTVTLGERKGKFQIFSSNNALGNYNSSNYKNPFSSAGEITLPKEVEHGVLIKDDKGKLSFVEGSKSNSYEDAEKYITNKLLAGVPSSVADQLRKKYFAFAQGGLVDYTGPAWVDGSRSRPEAFLSAEDTRRIGEAARILADLPILSQPVNKDTITNNTVGDTNIQIEVNVDQIASDYDVDEAVNRVEQKIVEAAKYAGSNVILKKR